MKWKAIVAMAENRVIGAGGKIPWHFSKDLKFFKEHTTGHTIVMGRKTWDSLGRPLPKRLNVVVSRTLQPGESALPGALVAPNLGALDQLPTMGDIWIIGGEEIYALALPRCTELYVTHVTGVYPGDTFFPAFEDAFTPAEILHTTPEFRIVRYTRR